MNPNDQIHIIADLIDRHAREIPRLDADTFYRYRHDPEKLMHCAAFYDELIEASVNFKDALDLLHEKQNSAQILQIYLLQAMACLHADEHQVSRILRVKRTLTDALTNFKKLPVDKTLELQSLNLAIIKHHPDALRALQYIVPQSNESWLNIAISTDDATLAASLLDKPDNIISSHSLKSAIGDNPNIRRMLYGTSKHIIKDLYYAFSHAFSSDFNEGHFIQSLNKNYNQALLRDHAESILALCFRKLLTSGRFGDQDDIKEGQEKAISTVLKLLTDSGADWYKCWCATREYDYVPALIDLQDDTYTDEERLKGYFNDERIYNLKAGTVQEAARRIMTNFFSPEAMCQAFSGRYDSDGLFEFFHQQTKNPIFLSMIQSNELKREILADGLGL